MITPGPGSMLTHGAIPGFLGGEQKAPFYHAKWRPLASQTQALFTHLDRDLEVLPEITANPGVSLAGSVEGVGGDSKGPWRGLGGDFQLQLQGPDLVGLGRGGAGDLEDPGLKYEAQNRIGIVLELTPPRYYFKLGCGLITATR